jgi:hypothetical protein
MVRIRRESTFPDGDSGKIMTNIVPFPAGRRSASPSLPSDWKERGHSAEIRFFTGVRYSRDTAPEPHKRSGGRPKRRRARS